MYKIKDFAAMTGMPASKIRFYEKRGLFSSRREENGYRVFTPEDAFRSNAFRTLLQYGFTIEETIEMIDAQQGTEEFRSALENQRDKLRQEAELLRYRMAKLDSALGLIETGDDPDFTLIDVPDQLYVRASHGRDFSVAVKNERELAAFYDILSITSCARIIAKSDFENDSDIIDPSYVNTMSVREAKRLKDVDPAHLEHLCLGKCVRFRRRVTRAESVHKETFADLMTYLDDHGYELRGDMILFPTFLNLDGHGSDVETLFVPVR